MTAPEQAMPTSSAVALLDSSDPGQNADLHLPGDKSMWVFVLGDMIIFGAYFVIFMIERSRDHTLFLASQQHLNQNIGLINTLVMLTSSWFVARAVQASRTGNYTAATRLTVGGFSCGVLFILVKVYEWSSEIRHGYTLPKNEFFTFYFMLTGIHLLHVIMGLIILVVVWRELRSPELRRATMVESGAIYWHMVDMLWIVIFALIYVMR